jgi:uncharacterized protein YecE (DUF72 family)
MAPLTEYARVFSAVEGNTTFYRVPSAELVSKWREAVAGRDFRFCFKLPRSVTHEHRADFDALDSFLSAIAPLDAHLGPLLVQFPASVGPESLPRIECVLQRLPGDRRHVLEVRHPAFFAEPALLQPVIERFGLGRVTMDTRALYRGDPDHPEVRAARHEKPDVPVLDAVDNDLRFVRLVLHPSGEGNARWLDRWAARIADDLAAGRTAYVLIHCPNNLHCPPFARDFHDRLRRKTDSAVRPLPSWPTGLSDS